MIVGPAFDDIASVASGTTAVAEIARAIIARIREFDPELQAFEYFDADLIQFQAQQLASNVSNAPLAGMTVGVKDTILTKDMPTSYNTPRYAGCRADIDAGCVDLLRGKGALIVGKTVTAEFAASNRVPKTINPWDQSRSPGGSSTGSAVAVAAGLCSVSIGTQTGGSIIRPASYNGVFGWKPSWNAISLDGVRPNAPSFDTIGFFARAAEDFALLADVYGLHRCAETISPHDLRIGLCSSLSQVSERHTDGYAAMMQAAKVLETAGYEIGRVFLPATFADLPKAVNTILMRELRASFVGEVAHGATLSPEFSGYVDAGAKISAGDIRDAYAVADRCRAALDQVFLDFDLLLTPSTPAEAPLDRRTTGNGSLNTEWTLMHLPVVSVPGLSGPSGLPIGVSVVSRFCEDFRAIGFASRLATLFDGRDNALVPCGRIT